MENYIPLIPLAFFGLILLASGLFTVKQQTYALVERLGKFKGIKGPGLHFKIPFVDRIAGRVNMKIQQLDVMVETKTFDDVFVKTKVSVQFQVQRDTIFDAFYKLESPYDQITSYVFDVVRAEVPKMKLDDVFVRKDDIAIAIKRELADAMNNYGYGIVKALVTDIDPDIAVKNAMNRINAAEREKTAAEYDGEAERIRIVAKAKAEAESKRLQGQGIADQRREIAKGLEDSVDMLNKVLLPNSPTAGSDMLTEMVTSFTASQQMGEAMKEGQKKKERLELREGKS